MKSGKPTGLSGACLIEDEMVEGYHAFEVAEFNFILHDTVALYADFLYEVLSGIVMGRTESNSVRSVTAGRGCIFFVQLPDGEEIVIRPYRHGGLFGRVSGWNFPDPNRFVSELVLTEKAREAGVTVLQPVGIGYVRSRKGFRGFWMTRRLKEARNLQVWMRVFPPSSLMVSRIAETIGRMHRAGISHPDLTVQNIMIIPDLQRQYTISIIDFDCATLCNPLSDEARMRQLRRLDRSFLKWVPETSPWQTPVIRLRFAVAYCRLAPDMRPLMKGYLRKIRRYLFRYRAGWRLQKVIKGS